MNKLQVLTIMWLHHKREEKALDRRGPGRKQGDKVEAFVKDGGLAT